MKNILITGASTGIGYTTAKFLIQRGFHVYGSVRKQADADRLKTDLGAGFSPLIFDVTDEAAVHAAAQMLRTELNGEPLSGLVNNAGVATSGEFLSTPIEDWNWVFSINVMGVVHGCKAFGSAMAERKRGHIVNIASAAGYYAAPDMSAYSASKHAVMGLSESLRIELAEFNVGVSAICPGVINTNIVSAMRTNGETVQAQAKIVDIYKKRNYGPEGVAEAIVSAIKHNRAVVPVSPEAWALYAAKRAVPSVLDAVQRTALFRKLKP